MKKNDLTSKTVAELKALAKKNKISLPAGSNKADIVKVLAKGAPSSSTSKRKAAVKAVSKAKAPRTCGKKEAGREKNGNGNKETC